MSTYNCAIIGDPDARKTAVTFLTLCDFFGEFIELDSFNQEIIEMDYVFITEPDMELGFLGIERPPWVITWSSNYQFQFIDENWILRVPPERYLRGHMRTSSFKRLLLQTSVER